MTLRSSTSNEPPFPRLFFYRGGSGDERTDRWPNWPPISLGWRLFGLVLLCLIPRAVMAWLVEPICHDGHYYISIASAFHDGEWATGFSYLNLNVYPVILVALNSLGLEWIFAGKIWSVVISSLAVLPLFGWVRRLFSDQVAWAAGFLYSLHAEFVELSFEPIRDPTFWFLFNFCLYTTVRALTEVKIRWFLANGLALTLAIHTRSEGWLLTIPLFLWLARQLVIQPEFRKRLLGGTALCLAVLPGLILLINLTILRDQAEWQVGRLNHFVLGWKWIEENVKPLEPPAEPQPDDPPPAGASPESPTVAEAPQGPEMAESDPADPQSSTEVAPASPTEPPRFRKYLKDMASALEQISLGLLVVGMCWSGRELINWDRGTLFALAFALAAGVWIVYDHHGHLNNRYFLPISLTLMPYFGIGYLLVFHAFWNRAERSKWSWLKPQYTAIFLILLSIGLGWTDSFTTDYTKGEREIEFGQWLEEEYGPFRSVAADCESARPAYTIQRGVPETIYHWSTLNLQRRGQSHDLLILSHRLTPPHCRPAVRAEAERLGLKPLALPPDHFSRNHFLVFVRPQAAQGQPAATAESPQMTSRR